MDTSVTEVLGNRSCLHHPALCSNTDVVQVDTQGAAPMDVEEEDEFAGME